MVAPRPNLILMLANYLVERDFWIAPLSSKLFARFAGVAVRGQAGRGEFSYLHVSLLVLYVSRGCCPASVQAQS